MDFNQAVQDFKEMLTQDVEAGIASGQDLVVFVGRASCPYCQRFAPKLAQVQKDYQLEIGFVNSENLSDLDALQAFRERYDIVTVPSLVVVKCGQVKRVCDSSLSEAEIARFIGLV